MGHSPRTAHRRCRPLRHCSRRTHSSSSPGAAGRCSTLITNVVRSSSSRRRGDGGHRSCRRIPRDPRPGPRDDARLAPPRRRAGLPRSRREGDALQARATAREADLDRCPFVQDGPDLTWFTWTGTRIQRTLAGLGIHLGGFRVEDRGIALSFEKAPREACSTATAVRSTPGPSPKHWPQGSHARSRRSTSHSCLDR